MNTTPQKLNTEKITEANLSNPRFAYSDWYNMPVAMSIEYAGYQYYYQLPKDDTELETIKVYDLDKYPAGISTNGAEPVDVITYGQDTVAEQLGAFEYAEQIILAYINDPRSSDYLQTQKETN